VKAISGKDFAKLLEASGWSLQRINGSHHIYGKAGSKVRISVPIHGNESLKIGLQRHLMRLAGMVWSSVGSEVATGEITTLEHLSDTSNVGLQSIEWKDRALVLYERIVLAPIRSPELQRQEHRHPKSTHSVRCTIQTF
jgi:predicted RNA binding protein YcfA (HicA-like mRNA interferase family)